jgi:MFS family permease
MFTGISSAAIIVPTLMELLKILNKSGTDEDFVSDISSSIWNFGNYLGEALGPLIGGIITHRYSFSMSCNFVSSINLLFGIIYFAYSRKIIKAEILKNYDSLNQGEFMSFNNNDLKKPIKLQVLLKEDLIKTKSRKESDFIVENNENTFDYLTKKYLVN